MPQPLLAVVVLLAGFSLAACSIEVRKHDGGRQADVDVRIPNGALSVRTSVPPDGTGLAVYPNAWPSREHGRDESADVDIDTAWFGVKVVAAKFETDDDPAKVLAFYRDEMARYAPYLECRGRVRWQRHDRPTCREGWSREVKLVAGVEDRQRIVTVKPRAGGTEFAMVYAATKD